MLFRLIQIPIATFAIKPISRKAPNAISAVENGLIAWFPSVSLRATYDRVAHLQKSQGRRQGLWQLMPTGTILRPAGCLNPTRGGPQWLWKHEKPVP